MDCKEFHVASMSYDIQKAARSIAEGAYSKGFRKLRRGEWIKDDTYPGKTKKIYICSLCKRWQAVKNNKHTDQLQFMNYCPSCGARMSVAEERAL